MKNLVIYGTGRATVIKIVNAINRIAPTFRVLGYINDLPEHQNTEILGYPVLGTRDSIPRWRDDHDAWFVSTIFTGESNLKRVRDVLAAHQCRLASLIHPDVDIDYVEHGRNCVIFGGVELNANVRLGDYVFIGSNSHVAHDSVAEDCVVVNASATVLGRVHLEEGCYIGAGAVILNDLRVGRSSIVGAGAVVTRDVPPHVTVAGVPARVIKSHEVAT